MKKSVRRIDHMLLCVPELEPAKRTYEKMGFFMTPLGDHRPLLGTANHTVTFPTNFLELLTIVDPDIPVAYRQSDVERREGVHLMGFTSDDVAEDIKALQHAQPGNWTDHELSTRRMTMPDGEVVQGSFDYSMQRIELDREIRFFVGKNTTREITWNPEFLNHPNGATRIAEILFVADQSRDALIGDLELILGPECKRETNNRIEFHTAEEVLVIKRRDGLNFEPASEQPYIAGISIALRDLDAMGRRLLENGFVVEAGRDGSLVVPPEQTHGICLTFVEEIRPPGDVN